MTDDLIPEALEAACKSIGGWLVVGGFDDDPAEVAKAAVSAYLDEARRIRRERIQAGIEHARKHGTRSGKPIGRPPLDKSKVVAIARDIASGDYTLAAIAMRYRIGEATVRRIRDGKHV